MEDKPPYVAFFGVMGATSAMVFSALGAAYGTAKSGTGIAAMSVMRPELIMKSIIPVVMAGIIAIYGLVVAVLVGNGSPGKKVDCQKFQNSMAQAKWPSALTNNRSPIEEEGKNIMLLSQSDITLRFGGLGF